MGAEIGLDAGSGDYIPRYNDYNRLWRKHYGTGHDDGDGGREDTEFDESDGSDGEYDAYWSSID